MQDGFSQMEVAWILTKRLYQFKAKGFEKKESFSETSPESRYYIWVDNAKFEADIDWN